MITHSLNKKQIAELRRNRLHRNWLDWYKRLIFFKEKFKRWPPNSEEYPKGIRLGAWVSKQKEAYRKDKILDWRRRLLEEIDLPLERQEYDWPGALREYEQWQKAHGRMPLQTGPTPLERRLGTWRSSQRTKANNGMLDKKQISMLQATGIFENYWDIQWRLNIAELEEFVSKNKRLPARGKRENEKVLAVFMHFNLARIRKGEMPKQKEREFKRAIKNAPFADDRRWHDRFEAAAAFKRKTGRLPSAHTKEKKEHFLGKWRNYQMELIEKGLLSPAKRRLFMKEGLHQAIFEMKHARRFEELVQYVRRENRLPHPKAKSRGERSLYAWFAVRKETLPYKKKIDALIKEHRLFAKHRDARWQKKFKEYVAYVKKRGRKPSKKSKDDYERSLAGWKGLQKQNYRQKKLVKERVKELKRIGII